MRRDDVFHLYVMGLMLVRLACRNKRIPLLFR